QIAIDMMNPYSIKNSCFWLDSLELVRISEEEEDCRGIPRVQYARKYVLLPPDATTSAWMEAAARGGMSQRLTVGYSADDSAIGDLDDREGIAVNPSACGSDLKAFFD